MYNETNGGWEKCAGNPVLGHDLGTCFDVQVLKLNDTYRMNFSWRTTRSCAMVESKDGINWKNYNPHMGPAILLGPREETGWEDFVNRPFIIEKGGKYQMWYCGQTVENTWIGYAESYNGRVWHRLDRPIMTFDQPWEKVAILCPHVIWDEEQKLYRMWYSAGEQLEPDAIGYATSKDGITWEKYGGNPIFKPDPVSKWEQNSVTACQVIKHDGWHLMFYIGFEDKNTARIGIARSKDGITNWERLPANPIISLGRKGTWDEESCYKPYALYEEDKDRWMLWYNGRNIWHEQIGLAIHPGRDLGFK